jgi:hypothetical protein
MKVDELVERAQDTLSGRPGMFAHLQPDVWFRALVVRESIEHHDAVATVAAFRGWFHGNGNGVGDGAGNGQGNGNGIGGGVTAPPASRVSNRVSWPAR